MSNIDNFHTNAEIVNSHHWHKPEEYYPRELEPVYIDIGSYATIGYVIHNKFNFSKMTWKDMYGYELKNVVRWRKIQMPNSRFYREEG